MGGRNQLGMFVYIPGTLFSFSFFLSNSSGIPALFSSSFSSGFISCGYLSLEVSAGFALLRIFRRKEEGDTPMLISGIWTQADFFSLALFSPLVSLENTFAYFF